MRALIASITALLLTLGVASATQASWPINFVTVAASNPAQIDGAVQYRFEVEVLDHRDGAVDARLLRSQRPDREPICQSGRSP